MQQSLSHSSHQHSDENSPHSMPMSKRGVTRPMMHESGNGKMMSKEERREMLQKHHKQTLWVYWSVIIIGAWLILAPFTFNYGMSVATPSGGREVWLSDLQRIQYTKWSDIISGGLLMFFGFRSLIPDRPISLWICCFIGVWLNIAPLIFWAPEAVVYLNDTICGILVIALTILIPGMPNMIMYMKMGSEFPEGWTYNPSSWPQRWIMIVTGFLGFIVSRYLASYQMGYTDFIWEPFFKSGEQVLNSSMSHSLPVSDAGLGALAYTFEFLMGFMGSPSRWRTMPWMMAFFGILVIPLGLVHIFLVISQPLVVGAWCTFCLLAAAIMLPMIPLEVDEVVAMWQHMVKAKRKGEKFWKVFWKGGMTDEKNKDERSPAIGELNTKFGKVFSASVWGMSVPRTLLASTIIGIGLMALPDQAGVPIQSSIADVNHLGGALIVVISVVSMGEVVRSFRFLNFLVGISLAIIPWFLEDIPAWLIATDGIAGLLVLLLTIPRGVKKEQYGLWDKYIR